MAGHAGPQLQPSIIPVLYNRAFLEKHNVDITDYGKHFCTENSKQGKVITRRDIEWYWEGNIRAEFDTVDPSHNRLISQTKCPKFELYWLGKTAVAALQAKKLLQEQQGLWLLKPKRKEIKHFKSAVILGNDTERWIVPDVSLMAIGDICFTTFAHNVRAANVGDNLSDSMLFRLWGTLVKKAYDFVPKEVQIQKLKEAFSMHPPTTEAGFDEFFETSSKKRKTAPSSKDDTFSDDYSVGTQKRRRVSLGEVRIRRFDKESTLDPTLKPILKHTYKTSLRATAGPSASASLGSSTKDDGGESGEKRVDPTQKKIQALEKKLAELEVAKDGVEHRFQSERGMRRGAETKIAWLEKDLHQSEDLVAQLQKRSTESV